ncbi:MAG: hypothetical protein H8D23_18385 [Candidatus Brocadiales bacterium]|nr:hypothetical protein [Candidatus Brocadiales bacterium]
MPIPAYMEDIADDTKFRFQTIKGIKHYNFRNKDEFLEYFGVDAPPLVEEWGTAKELDWVIADDGGVVQMLKVSNKIKHPRDTKNYAYATGWCRTVVGTFFMKAGADHFQMDTDWNKHQSRYTFSGSDADRDSISHNKRKHLTNKEKKFVFAILFSDIVDVYSIYSKIFNSVQPQNIKTRCDNLMREDRIMAELEKGVKEAAEKKGLTHEWVFDKLKHFADNAEYDADKIRSTIKIGDALGTFNSSKKQEQKRLPGAVGLFGEVTQQTLDDISKRPEELEEAEVIEQT